MAALNKMADKSCDEILTYKRRGMDDLILLKTVQVQHGILYSQG